MDTNTIQLVLSIVLAIATVAYTIINLMMWFESRATRRQKVAPQIIPYLKSTDSHDILCLYIKNVGEGCAKDVRVKVIKDYHVFNRDDLQLSSLPIFSEGVSNFPSGYELHYCLNWWEDLKKEGIDSSVILEITFKDLDNREYGPNKFELKFKQIVSNYTNPPETYEGQIAYYLKEIDKDLKKLNR
jgi:hypothetical protein